MTNLCQAKSFEWRRRWSRREKILFLERLELYVSAGLTINRALEISRNGLKKSRRLSVERVLFVVESGGLLSRALLENLNLPKTISGLIEHGESSGDLAKALNSARALMEREDELFKKCASAMTYPVIIGIFAALLTIGLVRGVMPQIVPMLKGLHVQLPVLTRVVIFCSETLTSYGLYLLGATILFGLTVVWLYRKYFFFQSVIHSLVLKLPIIGGLTQAYFLAVFLRSSGTLFESGLPISKVYGGTVRALGLIPLRRKLLARESDLDRGIALSEVVSHSGLPSYIPPLINAGEISGTLGVSMTKAASIVDRDLEHSLKRLTSLIEPVMMVGMGAVVGAIALSIIMPIYDISRVLQR